MRGLRRGAARALARLQARLGEAFEEYIERLRGAYPRSTIVLFGSRARGDHLPYSDYDIALILPGPVDKLDEAVRARSLKPPELPLDLVILEPVDLEDPLVAKMLKDCILLHDGLGLAHRLEELGCKKRRA